MYRRGCHDSLSELNAVSYPECGHPFDPADPRTFVTDFSDQVRQRLFMVGGDWWWRS